jgi:prevent-host-death family protein
VTAEHAELPIDHGGVPTEVVRRAVRDGEVVYLTDHGTRTAALVPADLIEELEILADPHEVAAIEEGLADAAAGRVRPLADVMEDLRAADRS